jgi:hypothetical protein
MLRLWTATVLIAMTSAAWAQSPDLLVERTRGNAKVIEAQQSIEADPTRFAKELDGTSVTTAFGIAGTKTTIANLSGSVAITREGMNRTQAIVVVAKASDVSLVYSVFRLLSSQRIETKSDIVFILQQSAAGNPAAAVAALAYEKKSVVAIDDLPLGSLGHRESGIRTLSVKGRSPEECQQLRDAVSTALAGNSSARIQPGTGCTLDIETFLGPNDLLSSTTEALESVDIAVKKAGLAVEVASDRSPRRISIGSDALQVSSGVLTGLGMQPQLISVRETSELLRTNPRFVALGHDGSTPANYARSVVVLLETVLALSGIR